MSERPTPDEQKLTPGQIVAQDKTPDTSLPSQVPIEAPEGTWRRKQLRIREQMFLLLFCGAQLLATTENALPLDARVVGCSFCSKTKSIVVHIESQSFDPVPMDQVLPEHLPVSFRRFR